MSTADSSQYSRWKYGGAAFAGVVAVVAAPISTVVVGVVAGGIAARKKICSLEVAFDGHLDQLLRSNAAAGNSLTVMRRFSKRIDQIHCDLGCSANSGLPGQPPPVSKQDLPLLRHSGLIFCLTGPAVHPKWVKLEFVREGLKFEVCPDPQEIGSSYLVEHCRLRDVSPLVVAHCLGQSRHRTYNAFWWNCNHVTDMIWDAVLTSSSQGEGPSDDSSKSTSSSQEQQPLQQHQQYWQQQQHQQQQLCKICFEQPKCIRFAPCGHYNSCSECALKVQLCPVCNGRIRERQRVYDD